MKINDSSLLESLKLMKCNVENCLPKILSTDTLKEITSAFDQNNLNFDKIDKIKSQNFSVEKLIALKHNTYIDKDPEYISFYSLQKKFPNISNLTLSAEFDSNNSNDYEDENDEYDGDLDILDRDNEISTLKIIQILIAK